MRKKILAYGLVAVASVLAIVRISNAYVEYQEHEMLRYVHPDPLRDIPQQPHWHPYSPSNDPIIRI